MSRKVRLIDLDMEFNSATDGAKYVDGNASNIRRCCAGKLEHAYGYKWEYVDEEQIGDIDICPEGELSLRIAILRQAMEDYWYALDKLDDVYLWNGTPIEKARASKEAFRLADWFLSDWGQALSFGHGVEIIDKVKEDWKEGIKPNYMTLNTFEVGEGMF